MDEIEYPERIEEHEKPSPVVSRLGEHLGNSESPHAERCEGPDRTEDVGEAKA